jgi:DNA (cytosine-5)-methyltransferase 1
MAAYYNEWNPKAAAVLRELIALDLIPAGEVDERSVADVRSVDLAGFNQCHFFAGYGGWPLAFRLAGIPDDAPAWSASVPCPDYSVASNGHGGPQGRAGSRHLWPVFSPLVSESRPSIVFGEQVASAIGWAWWDEVAMDLEAKGYAAAAVVLRADAYGADHERRRVYWCADASGEGREGSEQVRRFPVAAQSAFAKYGEPLVVARRALAGYCADLLRCDGLSLKVARSALEGFGNAIVPQVGARFIEAVTEAA